MLSAFIAFLGAIPGIGTIVTAITSKIFDSKVAIQTAKIGGDRDVAVALVKAAEAADQERIKALGVIAGSNILMFVVVAFAAPLIVYEWKVVVWDQVLGWGSTPEIKGLVANWGSTIIGFIFGAPTLTVLGSMWFNRK